ncbi:hypothetical protein AYO40_04180, partial [Planctomycetaceae bacterium SCGC AG-212-D15]
DPYLESRWADVHAGLATYARDQLTPQLPEDLYARLDEYLAVEADDLPKPGGYFPDVKIAGSASNGGAPPPASAAPTLAIAEPIEVPFESEAPVLRSIRIYDRNTGNRIISAIELLSPANKIGEAGRAAYRKKQRDLLEAGANLIEIDLLRDGGYVLALPQWRMPVQCRGPYRISVVRAARGVVQLYPTSLRNRLPLVRVPLRPTDSDVVLDLQPLLERSYDYGRYGREIDYRQDPQPPLSADDAAWADALLREKGLR